MERAVRNLTIAFILIAIGLGVGSSLAREVALHKHTAEELKSACDKVGGKFSKDPDYIIITGLKKKSSLTKSPMKRWRPSPTPPGDPTFS
jgi:hypothetical protein